MTKLFLPILKKIAIVVGKKLWSMRKHIVIFFLCNVKYRETPIRLSICYLYKIKLDNKYLLVKSQCIPNQYQPVGGVYKTKKGANKIFHELKVLSDDGYAYDNDLKDDLRIRIPGKNVVKFISWFESNADRENNPQREFREELLDTNVLVPRQAFENIEYNFLERNISRLHFSAHFQCPEILIKDIYEFIPNEKQEEILRNIFNKETDYYRWFEQSSSKLIIIGVIKPTPLSTSYTVRILYSLSHLPIIEVISPDLKLINKKLPHVYPGNHLCLFYPKNKEWTKYDYISDKIMPWISTWLYFYEIWDITGEWLGGGKHPESNDKKRDLDKYIN